MKMLLSLLLFTFALNAETMISQIPPEGMTISSPGTYVFAKDITWSPTGNGQAILITASDVTLDMDGFILKSETTPYYTTGIVALVSKNLLIKWGTIENMTYRGIDCTGCSNVDIRHMVVDGLSIENTVDYTVPVGILASVSSEVLVHKCEVKNIDVRTGSCAAIQMSGVTNSKIEHCDISNMLNRDGACTGIGHILCDKAEIKSCKLDGLKSEFIDNLNTEGHTAIGIIPFISTNLIVKDCKIYNIIGCCDDAHGISIFECDHAIVDHCKVRSVIDGAGPERTGAKATGIEVYGSDVQVVHCHVNYISAINPQDKQATGFSVAQGARTIFKNCHAKNVKVYNEFGVEDTTKGYGTGFGWAPDPRIVEPAVNIRYMNCTAKYCQLGFDSWFHIDSIWDNVYSKCNGLDILVQDSSAQRTLSCDACSECGCTFAGCYPNPFSITINNVASGNLFLSVKTKECDAD